MKDIKTPLLAMLSVGMVGTWAYHLYDKTQYASLRKEVYIKDSIAVAEAVADSLRKYYAVSIRKLDGELDSARLESGIVKQNLLLKMEEVNRLRAQINQILKNKNAKPAEVAEARQKIATLQTLLDEMKSQKLTLEEEKQEMSATMNRLNADISGLQESIRKMGDENKQLTEKVNLASLFVASEMKLLPMTVKNDREVETSQARKTSKLVISFTLQNNIAEYPDAEIFIIIVQPDGKVLTPDVWESATPMTTHSGDRKNYTRKVRFEYTKGESKPLIFSINADAYQTGAYVLQVYHRGYKIGQVSKTLV